MDVLEADFQTEKVMVSTWSRPVLPSTPTDDSFQAARSVVTAETYDEMEPGRHPSTEATGPNGNPSYLCHETALARPGITAGNHFSARMGAQGRPSAPVLPARPGLPHPKNMQGTTARHCVSRSRVPREHPESRGLQERTAPQPRQESTDMRRAG